MSGKQHLLIFNSRNLFKVDGSFILNQCGIMSCASLSLGENGPFRLCVIILRHHCCVMVDCFDTVQKLRKEIENETSIPMGKQPLYYFHHVLRKTISGMVPNILLDKIGREVETSRHLRPVPFSVVKAINDADEAGVSVDDYLDNNLDLSYVLYHDYDDDDLFKEIMMN